MSTPYEIPLVAGPQSVKVPINGLRYGFTFKWNVPANNWVIDIDDPDGNPLVHGIPMVTGVDLLAPFGYLGLGVQLIVQTDGNPLATPTFSNLGQGSHLYLITP